VASVFPQTWLPAQWRHYLHTAASDQTSPASNTQWLRLSTTTRLVQLVSTHSISTANTHVQADRSLRSLSAWSSPWRRQKKILHVLLWQKAAAERRKLQSETGRKKYNYFCWISHYAFCPLDFRPFGPHLNLRPRSRCLDLTIWERVGLQGMWIVTSHLVTTCQGVTALVGSYFVIANWQLITLLRNNIFQQNLVFALLQIKCTKFYSDSFKFAFFLYNARDLLFSGHSVNV